MIVLKGRLPEKRGDAAGKAGIGSECIEPIPAFWRHPAIISGRRGVKVIWSKYEYDCKKTGLTYVLFVL